MLVIRDHQMGMFAREARNRFEGDLATLFMATYPRETLQAGGKEQFVRILRGSIERAQSLGFTGEKQITLFIALTLMLGYDFYTDPQMPWAWKITARGNKNRYIDVVYEAAVAYLTATAGEDCEYVVRAMIRSRNYNLDEAPESTGDAFIQDVLDLFRKYYPEKYAFQGEELTRNLIAHGRQTSEKYGITANRGVLLLTMLMFMLGSGIDHDPLHPWASEALNDTAPQDQFARIDLLHRAAMAHIAQSLQSDDVLIATVSEP